MIAAIVLLCSATGCEPQPSPSLSSITFSGDALPTEWDTGLPFAFAGSGDPVVQDGFMDAAPGVPAVYVEATHGRPVAEMGADFLFDDHGGALTTPGVLALIAWDQSVVARGVNVATRGHVIISPDYVVYQVRTAPGEPIIAVARHEFDPPLATNVPYSLSVAWEADVATVTLPDGRDWKIRDPRIAGDDPYAVFEPCYINLTSDIRVKVSRIWFA